MASPLTAQQKLALQAELQVRRAALEAQRSRHLAGGSRAEHARELLLQDGHDAAQRDADREVDLARVDRDAVELAEIGQALERLASGHYGLCFDCGEPIAPARLQLAPQSARCVACASLKERGSARPARL